MRSFTKWLKPWPPVIFAVACAGRTPATPPPFVPDARVEVPAPQGQACGSGAKLRVHFYDVGQALSALIDLPDGRHILVDAADNEHRSGCGDVCEQAQRHLFERLAKDVQNAPIDLLWITHQHSDHMGGAPALLEKFDVRTYVDNGLELAKLEVKRARETASRRHTQVVVIDPDHRTLPFATVDPVRVVAVLPAMWPAKCKTDANDCSIMLRVDYCGSSVLFTGDAEREEEKMISMGSPVSLIQVGHHGSDTSTSDEFLRALSPHYAVISAGKPHEGLNKSYCHPRVSTVQRLSSHLGDIHGQALAAFSGGACDEKGSGTWSDVPASEHLWATERDGDVVLETVGNGLFERVH